MPLFLSGGSEGSPLEGQGSLDPVGELHKAPPLDQQFKKPPANKKRRKPSKGHLKQMAVVSEDGV